MKSPDIAAWHHPSFLTIEPLTRRGRSWCNAHINAEPERGHYLAEHSYGPTILIAAHNYGLTVQLDGRTADAPRETTP